MATDSDVSVTPTKMPKAKDRTVDMFTGQTNVEAAQDDNAELPKEAAPGIEAGGEDRWRDVAFVSKDWTTTAFYGGDECKQVRDTTSSEFRLTVRGKWMLLERKDYIGKSPFHYAGVMFTKDDLFKLTEVLAKACMEVSVDETREMFKRAKGQNES